MKKPELVFIPMPAAGHLVSTVEAAKLLLDRHHLLSITILIIKPSSDSIISSLANSISKSDRLQFIDLPNEDDDFKDLGFIDKQKAHVKEAVSKLTACSDSSLAGFVLDMFCTSMIDVAKEFGVPYYIFFTSGAAFLGFLFYVQLIHDEQDADLTQFKDSDAELSVPSLANSLPARVLPASMLVKDRFSAFIRIIRGLREAKGIMENDVGPEGSEIIEWLDDQPPSSVVFLCFGSMGGFDMDQAKEIACALEQSRHRFLWSLRRPPPKGKIETSTDYENLQEILPVGFSERTAGMGKVVGWAPQVAILEHPAIGGFVSHCGWNSILESIWFSVPIATWPLYAEQQFNAFTMVTELGLAVEIKMDYKKESEIILSADDIERGIKSVMEHHSEIRKRVKEMSDKSRKALMDDESSSFWLDRLIEDVINNLS
ncbi:hypothetical protein MANES_09G070538v8 [Manihot esculenta]|uniref:Glycosyltransferase n=2 Tax=Manihot esculenta TaxID=3983 RepID=A0A2C9W0B4_MANES|nr:hypothetical protein MANES_09G070538v8 [Manihot esculenta]